MKANILFLLHLPPPVHGSSVVGLSIKESIRINSKFNAFYFNLIASNEISESGKISILKFRRFINVWMKTLYFLMKNKPAICYMALTTTGSAFKRDVFFVLLSKIFRIKIVYHLHNKGVKKYTNHRILKHIYRYVFKNSNVILLSENLYQDIEPFVNRKSIHVCPNGIYPFSVFNKKKNNEIPRILFLSNLIKTKGVLILLEACKILKEKNIRFYCDFVGSEGDISSKMFESLIAENNLCDIVKYYGKVYGKEKELIYSNSDLFAFPTFYENECYPLVLIEAMQAKLPIVSTFEGGIPDIITEGVNGFLIERENPRVLAEKLEILILDKDLRIKMGEAGYKSYLQKNTIEVFEEKIISIFEKIISK